jgi:hypothetical protein
MAISVKRNEKPMRIFRREFLTTLFLTGWDGFDDGGIQKSLCRMWAVFPFRIYLLAVLSV